MKDELCSPKKMRKYYPTIVPVRFDCFSQTQSNNFEENGKKSVRKKRAGGFMYQLKHKIKRRFTGNQDILLKDSSNELVSENSPTKK